MSETSSTRSAARNFLQARFNKFGTRSSGSQRFGMLNVDEISRLTSKKASVMEELVSTVRTPQRKALVPDKKIVWALKKARLGSYLLQALRRPPRRASSLIASS